MVSINIVLITINLIVSVVIGMLLWYFQNRLKKSESKRQTRESCLEEFYSLTLNTTIASVVLGEVTAQAVRDGHANGELQNALDAAKEVKEDYQKFIRKQSIKNIINLKG